MWWRRWRRRLPVAVTWTRPTTEDQRMQEEELGWNGETRSNVRAGPSGIRSVPSAPEAPLEAAFRCQQRKCGLILNVCGGDGDGRTKMR